MSLKNYSKKNCIIRERKKRVTVNPHDPLRDVFQDIQVLQNRPHNERLLLRQPPRNSRHLIPEKEKKPMENLQTEHRICLTHSHGSFVDM